MADIPKRKTHKPAAMRQIGWTAYGYYFLGLLSAVIWIYLVSVPVFNSTVNSLGKEAKYPKLAKMTSDRWKRYEEHQKSDEILRKRIDALGRSSESKPITAAEVERRKQVLEKNTYFSMEETAKVEKRLNAKYEIYKKRPTSTDLWRFFIFGGVFLSLMIFFVMGSRYAAISSPNLMPRNMHKVAGLLFVSYVLSFVFLDGSVWHSFWPSLTVFGAPFLMLTAPTGKMAFVEYAKEHPVYRRIFVLGRGGEAARLSGLHDYFNRDMTEFFKSGDTIKKTETSQIYLGRTLIENDIRVGGRQVGLINSEQHMMTVATTGAGKSRDAIYNTILNYSGGICAFDMKGEIVRLAYQRRKTYAPCYVLDPYHEVSELGAGHTWNPLAEIKVDHPAAREMLKQVAVACIYPEQLGNDSPHFRDNAQDILRGYMAHVITAYPPELRHLGTVYDLLKTGEPEGKTYNPKAIEKVLIEMSINDGIEGAPRDAANLLNTVGPKERGSLLSTISRGIDWVNSKSIRPLITQQNTFSLSEIKSKEASVFLVMPEMYINEQIRFIRTFYSIAFAMCDNHITKQPIGSQRRALFLFDEFNKLGYFQPAEDAALTKRGSFLKCWFVIQNLEQLSANYKNEKNIITQCDKQFFGLDAMDDKALALIQNSVGHYTEMGDDRREQKRPVLSQNDIAELLDVGSKTQIIIPVEGKPIKLARVPFYNNYSSNQYGISQP